MSRHKSSKNSERGRQKRDGRSPAPRPRRLDYASPQTDILAMQHNAGNQAVNALLRRGADNESRAVSNVPRIVHEVLRSPGQPLDPATRAIMEPPFGHDFSQVRVHSDAKAAESARAVDARAYTLGQDVVFSEGGYSPHSHEGSKLLAHELAHVIQQERGGASPPSLRGGALERHADAAASAFAQGQSVHVQGASSPGLARQPLPGAREPRPKLRELLKLDPRNPNDRQLADELDLIEKLLNIDDVALGPRYPWGDRVILEKAMELNKNTGGKMGGAVLAYYDRLVSGAIGGMLAQATTPVVKMTDPSGRVEALVTAAQVAQAHKKLQMDTALGLIQGFATAGAVGAAGALAVGLLMLAATAAPAVFGTYAGASAMTADAALALALRLTPRLMAWAARNPYLAEAVVTGVVGMALDIAETGNVDPMQLVFNFLQIRQTQLQTRSPRLPTTPPEVTTPPTVTTAPEKMAPDPKASAMRRPPGGGDRAGMTATEGTLTPHKRSDPVVEVLPRGTVPMKDFDPPEPGHYIVRKPPDAETKRQILARAGRTSDGRLRDANTGRALEDGEAVWGHAPNYQFKEMRDMAEKLRWTQDQFDEFFKDPAKWQVEYGPTNSGRVFDRIPRQRPVH